MKRSMKWPLALIFLFLSTSVQAQNKPSATTKDYATWHTLGQVQMSPDGQWMAWAVTMQENNDTLWVKNVQGGEAKAYAFASQASFSGDNRWLAMRIGVSYAEQEKLTEQKKPVDYALGLVNLATMEMTTVKGISGFNFSEDGKWLAITLSKPADSKATGNTVLLREMATGLSRSLGNVTESSFNKKANRFAYITAGGSMHTLELINLTSAATTVIVTDTTKFSRISWDREGQAFAFYSAWNDAKWEEETQKVHFYHALAPKPSLKSLDPLTSLPEGMRVLGSAQLRVSDDLQRVHFGLKEWTRKPEPDTSKAKKPAPKKDKLAPVDVWNWNDKEIQPRQKITYNQDLNLSYETVWHLQTNKVVALADQETLQAMVSTAHSLVISAHTDRYRPAFKEDFADFYVVDIQTGTKKLLLENQVQSAGGTPMASTTGRYITYFKDNHHYVYDTKSGKHTNVTQNLPHPVYNVRDDRPGIIGPAGFAGWIKGDEAFLIYDEYDVWRIDAEGRSPRKLTAGREEQIIYRVQRLNFDDPYIDASKPIMLTMTGDNDRRSGYAQLDPKGTVKTLIFEPMNVGRLVKAKNIDQYSYVTQKWDVPPVLKAGPTLAGATTIFESNPQSANFAKGRAELVYFNSQDGRPLKGALHYPDNYEPGKQYPMVVYIYEIRSNAVHNYVNPSVRSAYNLSHYTAQGYFVFQPDIVYDIDDPGMSAVNCVVPAVEKVLETGMINPKAVGLMGHSWGGYQTAFLVTQTKLFSAAIAGAPLTNMMSMSLAIYWNSGTPNQKIFETSQGRFSGPWYEVEEAHWRNSPIIYADKIDTPMLMTFGDKDGAVDWHQGIEMYGTMRRMGKPFTMLVYADENHNFTKRENQMDYFNRVTAYLDHYLKGAEAPAWLTEGVSYVERRKAEDKK